MSGAKCCHVACRMAVFKSTFLTGVRADASRCKYLLRPHVPLHCKPKLRASRDIGVWLLQWLGADQCARMLAGKAQRGALLHAHASSRLAYTVVQHAKQHALALIAHCRLPGAPTRCLLLLVMIGAMSCNAFVEACICFVCALLCCQHQSCKFCCLQ